MKRKLWVVAGAGVAAMVGAVYLASLQTPGRPTEPDAVLTVVLGASLLGSGLASWRARPENRLGPVMVLAAFGFFASQLTEASPAWMYTVGTAVQYLWLIGFLYLLLTFPSGRLAGRLDRWLMGAVVALLCLPVIAMLDGNKAGLRCGACPDNVIQIVHNNQEALQLLNLQRLVGSILLIVIVAVLIRRWMRASSARRRSVAPVLVAGCATFIALAVTATLDLFGDPLNALPANVFFYLAATVPIAVMYFVASEALTNAAKHSHASEVRVVASCAGGTLTVEIADDGIGGAGTEGGSGLRGLADRVEALGGRFTVSSPPGRGTTLHAQIPCA